MHLYQISTKSLLYRQTLRKLLLENACGTTYVQNRYFEGKCSGNRYFKRHEAPHKCKTITLKANAMEIITWKWHLTTNMYKIVTLKANAQEIVTLKCMWHHISAKPLLWSWNAMEIITLKCVWHQICTKLLLWRQMWRKLLLENACGTTYVQNHYFEGKC